MPAPFAFLRSHRLSGAPAFGAVYNGRVRESRGPLLIYALPNDLNHLRLGLSVSRRVGNAVVRNRVKRLLREAFRFLQHDMPGGYDLVVVVKPHEPLDLNEYQRFLGSLILKLHAHWQRRGR